MQRQTSDNRLQLQLSAVEAAQRASPSCQMISIRYLKFSARSLTMFVTTYRERCGKARTRKLPIGDLLQAIAVVGHTMFLLVLFLPTKRRSSA